MLSSNVVVSVSPGTLDGLFRNGISLIRDFSRQDSDRVKLRRHLNNRPVCR